MSPSQNNHKLSEGNSVAVAEAATSPPPAAPSPAGTGTVESAAMLMNSREGIIKYKVSKNQQLVDNLLNPSGHPG